MGWPTAPFAAHPPVYTPVSRQHRGGSDVILVFVNGYLPGYRAGGPIRSIAALVELLGDEFDFRIVAPDRDYGQAAPYERLHPGTWHTVGKARVYYSSPRELSLTRISQLMREVQPSAIYLNSLFSPDFALKPLLLRRLGLAPRVPFVLAPRGELSSGALALKAPKKKAFLAIASHLGLYQDLTWQASSPLEAGDIERVFGPVVTVIAPNLRQAPTERGSEGRTKRPGSLKVAFLSRISRKKNLFAAIEMLEDVVGDVEFNVYGPAEDREYAKQCEDLSKQLPPNVRVRFHGEIEHESVQEMLATHHLFLLPTHGENFGHVIVEALSAGCGLLLSDQTPWRNLAERGVGYDLALSDSAGFRSALRRFVDMGDAEFSAMSVRATALARETLYDPALIAQNRLLFETSLQRAKEPRSR